MRDSRPRPPLFLLCIVATATALAAVPALAQDLQQAWQQAYTHNPGLQAQRAALAAAEARRAQAEAGWKPTVRFSGDLGSEQVDTALAPAMGSAHLKRTLLPRSVAVSVEQSVYDGGDTAAAVSAADNRLQAEQAHLNQSEQQVYLSVAKAYLDVLLNQSVLELEQHNVETLDKQLEATRLREQAGELTPTDVYQAQARLAQAKARRRHAEAKLAQSGAAYQRAVGSAPQALSPPATAPTLPASLARALQQAGNENPQLSEAGYRAAVARNQLRRSEAESGPTVRLSGELRHNNDDSIFTERTDTRRIMLRAEIPLYSGGADQAKLDAAQRVAEQRQAEQEDTRDRVTEAVTAAWESWQAAGSELDALKEQQRAAQSAFNGVQAEQEAGSRTVLDVLNAQQELLNAQVSVASAKHDRQVAAYRLLSAIGTLQPAKVESHPFP